MSTFYEASTYSYAQLFACNDAHFSFCTSILQFICYYLKARQGFKKQARHLEITYTLVPESL